MWNLFTLKTLSYNLRSNKLLSLEKISNNKGRNSFKHRGALLWNKLPDTIKYSVNLTTFKNVVKKVDSKSCSCKICQQ